MSDMDISSPALPTVESVSKATRKRKGSSSSEDGLRKKKKGRQEDVKTTSEIDSELDIELPVGDCLFEFWERTKESMIALRWIRDEDLVRSQASQLIRRECVGPDEISVLTIISEPKANHPKWPSVIFKVVNSRIDNPKEETDILESIQELFIACGGEPQLVILLNFVAPVTVASVRDTLKFEREHGTKEQALARQPQCYLEIWGHRGLKEECDLYLHTPRMNILPKIGYANVHKSFQLSLAEMFGPSCVPAGRDPNEKGFSWDLESLREIITSMMDRFIDLIKVFPGPEAFQYLEIAKPPGHLNVITIGKRPEILDPLHLIDSDDGENWWMHTKNNRYLEEEAFRVESSPEMSPSPVTSSSSDSNQEINSITTPAALKQERIAQPPQYHHQKMPTKSSSKRQSIGILMPVTPNRPRTLQPSQISMMSPRTPCPVRARRSIIDDDYDAGSSSEADCWSGSRRSMGTSSGRNSSGFQSSRDFSSSSSEENSLTKANKTGLSAAFLYP